MSVFLCVAVVVCGNLAQFIVLWFLDMFGIFPALMPNYAGMRSKHAAATDYTFSGHCGQLQGQHNDSMNNYAQINKKCN